MITAAGYAQETIRISLMRDTLLTVPLQARTPPAARQAQAVHRPENPHTTQGRGSGKNLLRTT